VKSATLVKRMRKDGVRVFLDSGAYSAFTKGHEIDVRTYAQWIRDNNDLIELFNDPERQRVHFMASVLDKIGQGRESADGTFANQKRLEDMGIMCLPCYHYGEPEYVLEYYLTHYPYITIGGMVPISVPQLQMWLDRIWKNYLTHPDGTRRVKVHGFGLTSIPLMTRYPWYSVDSAAWVQKAMFGNVIFPDIGIVQISEHSPAAKKINAHLDTMAQPHADAIREKIIAHGFDPERLRTNRDSRIAFNINTFTILMREVASDKFTIKQPVLF
jgi:hypothetical protein